MGLWPNKHTRSEESERILEKSEREREVVRSALRDLKDVLDTLETQMEDDV